MKKKILLIAILASLSQNLLASDREDLKYIYKLFQNKEYVLSIDELERFLIKYPSSEHYSAAQNLLAQSYYQSGDYANAKIRYSTLLQSNYGDEANYYLSLIAIKEEKYTAAEAYVLKIPMGNKYREAGLYQLGATLYREEKVVEATNIFNRIRREKGPYEKLALFNLGLISYNKGEYFRTSVYLEEFLSKEKNDFDKLAPANYMLGYSYYQVDDINKALEFYNIVEREYYTSAYYQRAARDMLLIYIGKNNEEKIDYYTNELIGSEFEALAYQNTGNYYYKKNNFEKAEKSYEKALAKGANDDITYLLGRARLSLDKKESALFSFEKLKGNNKYLNEYYYYKAYILFNQKEYGKVVNFLQSIEEKGLEKDFEKQLYYFIADSAFSIEEYRTARKYYGYIYKESKKLEDFYKLFIVNNRMKDIIDIEKLYTLYNKAYASDREYRKDIYLVTGNLLVENGELAKGEKVYKDFLSKQEDETITENLVTVLSRQGKYDELLLFLEKLDPTAENVYLKGLAYLGLGNFIEATRAFNYLINSNEISIETQEKATVKLIETSFASKDYEKTLSNIEIYDQKSYKLANEEVEKSRALAYFRLGKYENARFIYEKQLENPEKADFARFMIAESYYNEKKYEKAKENYLTLYTTTKNRQYAKDAAYWLIRIESFQGNYGKLEGRINGFRVEFPNSEYEEDITYILASAHLLEEQKDKAIKEYEGLYVNTNNPNVKEQSAKTLTELYFNNGNTAKALEWNDNVKDKNFRSLWLGVIYEKAGEIEKAIESYISIRDSKDYGDISNYNLGRIYLARGEYTKARTALERVLSFETSKVKDKAQYNIGLSYEKEENYTRAISSFMRIKLLYTESDIQDITLIKLAENYERSGNEAKAIESYREFYDNYKSSPDYTYVVEKLLVYAINNKKIDVARSYYNELTRLNKNLGEQYKEYLGGE